tara:strand:- start:363 stop:611 length:249 start_codon:yes stop_codon:yes gene_type:complete
LLVWRAKSSVIATERSSTIQAVSLSDAIRFTFGVMFFVVNFGLGCQIDFVTIVVNVRVGSFIHKSRKNCYPAADSKKVGGNI